MESESIHAQTKIMFMPEGTRSQEHPRPSIITPIPKRRVQSMHAQTVAMRTHAGIQLPEPSRPNADHVHARRNTGSQSIRARTVRTFIPASIRFPSVCAQSKAICRPTSPQTLLSKDPCVASACSSKNTP